MILERSHLKACFETYVCNIIDIWIKVLPKEKLQMLKRVHKINKVKFKVNVQFLHFFGYLRRTINQQCAVPRVLFNLHVLWQVSFGCWVTWSTSSWQKFFMSVFFLKARSLINTRKFRPHLNFLQNEYSQSSQIYLSQEKLRKLREKIKIDQNINFAKFPSAK